MKKFLLMAAAGLMAFGANAADWYISGAFQGWKHCQADYKFTETTETGVFTLDLSQAPSKNLSGAFVIVQGTPNNPNWNNKIGTKSGQVKADVPYTYALGGGDLSMAGTVENAVLTLDTNKKTLLVTGKAKENDYDVIYITGDFGSGWSDDVTKYPLTLKEGTDNVWTGEYKFTAANNYFKMKAGSNIYGPDSDTKVVFGEEYTAKLGSSVAYVLNPGTYTFTFTLDKNAPSGKLVVSSDQPVTYPETFFIIGNVNGKDWAANNGIELEKIGEGLFKGQAKLGTALGTPFGYFSFTEALGTSWDTIGTRYGAKTSDFFPQIGQPCEITYGTNAYKLPGDLIYEFTVDLVNKTILCQVVKEVVMPTPPEKLALEVGTSTGMTMAWNATYNELSVTGAVTTATAEVTLAIPEGFDNYLYIDPTQGGGPQIEPLTRAAAEWLPVSEALAMGMQYGNKFTVAADGQEHPFNLYLVANEQFDSANLYLLTVKIQQETGVEAIEAAGEAQYFNLQGVKVANPEKGIYVKVVNGKASKVTVK